MLELLEKTFLTGLGVLSLSQKRAEEFLDELKEKYKVSEEEGKAFLDKMQGIAKESRDKVTELAEAEVKKALEKFGLVSREEFELLQKRIDTLEGRAKKTASGDPC